MPAPRIAIAAVMKQEGDYVLEWVAWHRLLGFEILIADNGGSDRQTELLQCLSSHGIITRLDLQFITKKPQIPAYNALLAHGMQVRHRLSWLLGCR